jgi:hypothetical protein
MKTQRDEPYQITKHSAKIMNDVVLSLSGYGGSVFDVVKMEAPGDHETSKISTRINTATHL